MSLVELEFDWRTRVTPEQAETIQAFALGPVPFEDVDPEAETFDREDAEKAVRDGRTKKPAFHSRTIITHIDLLNHLDQVEVKVLRRIQNRSTEALAVNPNGMGRESQGVAFNERCQVAIPMSNAGLLAVAEVDVAYDSCTDALRERLKDGWRILAVCPQPDQRRPDYVLGRIASATNA